MPEPAAVPVPAAVPEPAADPASPARSALSAALNPAFFFTTALPDPPPPLPLPPPVPFVAFAPPPLSFDEQATSREINTSARVVTSR